MKSLKNPQPDHYQSYITQNNVGSCLSFRSLTSLSDKFIYSFCLCIFIDLGQLISITYLWFVLDYQCIDLFYIGRIHSTGDHSFSFVVLTFVSMFLSLVVFSYLLIADYTFLFGENLYKDFAYRKYILFMSAYT